MTDIDQAEWWCALCPTSHPTEAALLRHAAKTHAGTDIGLRSELKLLTGSTSAQLRQTQQDLAASQADLTRAERERDEALRRCADLEQVREELKQARLHIDGYHADYQKWSGEKQEMVDRSLLLKAELATATAELELLRAPRTWRIARQDVGPCGRCGQPIVPGLAVEPMPGTTKGSYAHVECPEPEETPHA